MQVFHHDLSLYARLLLVSPNMALSIRKTSGSLRMEIYPSLTEALSVDVPTKILILALTNKLLTSCITPDGGPERTAGAIETKRKLSRIEYNNDLALDIDVQELYDKEQSEEKYGWKINE